MDPFTLLNKELTSSWSIDKGINSNYKYIIDKYNK